MSISQNLPSEGPNLYINFAGSKTLDPRLTFSRNSTATYVDDDGITKTAAVNQPRFDHNPLTGECLGLLEEESRTNYVLRSNNIAVIDVNGRIIDTTWKQEVFGSSPYGTITLYPNYALAPDGTMSATRMTITDQSVGGSVYLIKNQVHESGNLLGTIGTYTMSMWMKSNTSSNQTVKRDLAQYSGSASYGGDSTTITVTPQWQRFKFTYIINTIGNIRVMFAGGSGGSNLDILIWGAQLEVGSYPTSHIPTIPTFTSRASSATYYDSAGILRTAATNVARSDAYFPDNNGVFRSAGLLLEPAATNIVSYSEQFGAWFLQGVSISSDVTTAPNGTTTADKLIPSTDSGSHNLVHLSSKGSGTFTFSVYAKADGYPRLGLRVYDGTAYRIRVTFDISTGSIASLESGIATITPVGNGWYRCSCTGTSPSGNMGDVAGWVIESLPSTSVVQGSFAGNGTSGAFVWGAQIEAGNYASSYIQTVASNVTRAADLSTSSTVTRAADSTTLSGTSTIFNSSGGTLLSLRSQDSSTIDSSSLTLNQSSLTSSKALSEILYYPSVLTSTTVKNMRGFNSLVTNGLVLYLDAGNTASYSGTGTTWTDLSNFKNNGTLTNGPTYSSANEGSLVFDGSNDYMTAGSIPSGTDLFTLSCWIYFNGNLSGNLGVSKKGAIIFSGNASGTMEFNIGTFDINSGPPYEILLTRYGGGTTGSCIISPLNMSINQYHNITLVRDGTSSQKVYQNGVLIGTGNVSNSFTGGTLHLGGAPSNATFSGHLNGRLSNVLRYNRALTASEISQNFNALRGRFSI